MLTKRPRGRPIDAGLQVRRREEILATATEVFARLGYPNTDVQFVADPLGISKGTVYRYFPTKECLFLAAVERGVARLNAEMNAILTTVPDPIDRLAAGVVAHLRFFEANPALVELFVQERAEFRDRGKPIYFAHGGEGECAWTDMLRDLIAAGRLRDVPVERISDVACDLLYGTMFTNHFLGRRRPFEEQAADINDILFNGTLTDSERTRRERAGPAAGPTPARVSKAIGSRGRAESACTDDRRKSAERTH